MANYHACKVVAVGKEEEMKSMLQFMLDNVGCKYDSNDSVSDLKYKINDYAEIKDVGSSGFTMDMLSSKGKPKGRIYSDESLFSVNKANGYYVAIFEWQDADEFHPKDFAEISEKFGVEVRAIHTDEDIGHGGSEVLYYDGDYEEDYECWAEIAFVLECYNGLGCDETLFDLLNVMESSYSSYKNFFFYIPQGKKAKTLKERITDCFDEEEIYSEIANFYLYDLKHSEEMSRALDKELE